MGTNLVPRLSLAATALIGLVGLGLAGLDMHVRERQNAKREIAELVASRLVRGQRQATQDQLLFNDRDGMGVSGTPVSEVRYCGLVRRTIGRNTERNEANCAGTAVACVSGANERVEPCHPTEISELPKEDARPAGDREHPNCSAGWSGPATCVVQVDDPAEGRRAVVTVH